MAEELKEKGADAKIKMKLRGFRTHLIREVKLRPLTLILRKCGDKMEKRKEVLDRVTKSLRKEWILNKKN
jgi:hypothetical protein